LNILSRPKFTFWTGFIGITGEIFLNYVFPYTFRTLSEQTLSQPVGKKLVIAIPAPLVIEHEQEQAGMFEVFQYRLPGGTAGSSIRIPLLY
jgi:hypothetical protein